jgi:hypothetical protein
MWLSPKVSGVTNHVRYGPDHLELEVALRYH